MAGLSRGVRPAPERGLASASRSISSSGVMPAAQDPGSRGPGALPFLLRRWNPISTGFAAPWSARRFSSPCTSRPRRVWSLCASSASVNVASSGRAMIFAPSSCLPAHSTSRAVSERRQAGRERRRRTPAKEVKAACLPAWHSEAVLYAARWATLSPIAIRRWSPSPLLTCCSALFSAASCSAALCRAVSVDGSSIPSGAPCAGPV